MPNSYFEEFLDTSDEWITTRTGIKERRMTLPGQALSDLAIPASERALEMAGIAAEDLDLIIVGTATPDMVTPSTSCLVQHHIGASGAAAFDVNAACPGFIYALSTAEKFIQTGACQQVLVIGGEVLSTRCDYEDRSTCVLFGDGAGAAVLGVAGTDEENRILSTHISANGDLWDLLSIRGPGSAYPPTQETLDQRLQFVKMNGPEVFKHAVRTMTDISIEALETNGLTADDLDWFIPHQANIRIIDAVGKKLDIDGNKVIKTVHKYGNTSSATIPTALDESVRSGQIKRGDLVLACSFGAGFVWGAALFRY